MEKLELVAAGGISPVRTDPDLVFCLMSQLTIFQSYVTTHHEMSVQDTQESWSRYRLNIFS